MSELESSFLLEIARQPHDWLPRLIFADWLEEQGDPRGELIRLSHQLTRLDCEDRQPKEDRLRELAYTWWGWPSPSLPNGLNLPLILIPPGQFLMGSPPDEPERQHDETQVEVTLTQGFWLGQHEVTQAEYEAVTGRNPSFHEVGRLWECFTWPNYPRDSDRYPVEQVSWEEAMEFCRKLTTREQAACRLPAGWEYTLPTEAQWEYACRAGTTTATSLGDELDIRKFNFQGDWNYFTSLSKVPVTDEVGSCQPNAWKLFDMHGNVWEWCRDWYVDQLPGGTDPEVVKTASDRVRRGGGFSSDTRECRSASRSWSTPDSRSNDLGFRIAVVQTR